LPEPEVQGLVALMMLHRARRDARTSSDGDIVLLADQDRSLWDQAAIAEASELVQSALRSGRYGAYTLQAAIAAVHSEAPTYEETDWDEIIGLYDVLLQLEPSPVPALNRAVAVAMRDGPESALPLVEQLLEDGALDSYHLAYAVQGDLLERAGRLAEASDAYRKALGLTAQEAERRLLEGKIARTGR